MRLHWNAWKYYPAAWPEFEAWRRYKKLNVRFFFCDLSLWLRAWFYWIVVVFSAASKVLNQPDSKAIGFPAEINAIWRKIWDASEFRADEMEQTFHPKKTFKHPSFIRVALRHLRCYGLSFRCDSYEFFYFPQTKMMIAERTRLLEIVGLSLSLLALVISLVIFYRFRWVQFEWIKNPSPIAAKNYFTEAYVTIERESTKIYS